MFACFFGHMAHYIGIKTRVKFTSIQMFEVNAFSAAVSIRRMRCDGGGCVCMCVCVCHIHLFACVTRKDFTWSPALTALSGWIKLETKEIRISRKNLYVRFNAFPSILISNWVGFLRHGFLAYPHRRAHNICMHYEPIQKREANCCRTKYSRVNVLETQKKWWVWISHYTFLATNTSVCAQREEKEKKRGGKSLKRTLFNGSDHWFSIWIASRYKKHGETAIETTRTPEMKRSTKNTVNDAFFRSNVMLKPHSEMWSRIRRGENGEKKG